MEKTRRKAVRTFIFNEEKVLAIKYLNDKNTGFYDIPGGKIENGENNINASIRECLEETGVSIVNQKYIGNLIIEYPNMIFDFDIFVANDFKGSPKKFNENDSMWIEISNLLIQKKKFPCIELLKKDFYKYFQYGNLSMKFIVDNNHKILKCEF